MQKKNSIKSSQTESRTHQNDHSPRSSSLHLRDVGMAQYMEIHQNNPLYNQTRRQNLHDHLIRFSEIICQNPTPA
jgi:hypothetical protein